MSHCTEQTVCHMCVFIAGIKKAEQKGSRSLQSYPQFIAAISRVQSGKQGQIQAMKCRGLDPTFGDKWRNKTAAIYWPYSLEFKGQNGHRQSGYVAQSQQCLTNFFNKKRKQKQKRKNK